MSFSIQGREVAIPVEVRDARSWFSTFAVPLDAAAELIAYSGLEPASTVPGRAIVSLAFVRYLDSDLGPYHEFAVAVLVREPGGASAKPAGAFIHQLPVDQGFTLEAGRTIWGFPKFLSEIVILEARRGAATMTLVHDAQPVLSLSIGAGVPGPMRATALDAFSWMDGVLRRTRWTLDGSGSRLRPGGARVALGDHPIAKELATLGLPRHALMTGSIGRVRMHFDAADVVTL